MSENKAPLNLYSKRIYNISGAITKEQAENYLKALVMIASADGELADEELAYLYGEQRMMGAPEEYLDIIRDFDWRNANLEELLGSLGYDFDLNVSRTLLYQAIKISRADSEYHKKERAAVRKAAELLKVDMDTVLSLEALAEAEDSIDRLRHSLLGTSANE